MSYINALYSVPVANHIPYLPIFKRLRASFPVYVTFTPATLPSKQTAQATAEHKQEVSSLDLNFS